jgi:hypothetical protein
VQAERRLARALRAVDLRHTSPRDPTHADRRIQVDRPANWAW